MQSFASFVAGAVPEVVAWGAFYQFVMIGQLAPRVERYCSGLSTWAGLKGQKSTMFGSAQVEVVIMITIAVHHIVSSLGIAHPGLARSGFLCELGFEVADLSNIFLGRYPYQHLAPEDKLLYYRHHAFGIMCILPMLFLGLEANEHVLAVTSALLLGGGLLALSSAASRLLDAQKFPLGRLALTVLTFVALLYTRCVVFPQHYLMLIIEEWDNLGALLSGLSLVSFLFMTSFNVPIVRIYFGKSQTAIKEYRQHRSGARSRILFSKAKSLSSSSSSSPSSSFTPSPLL